MHHALLIPVTNDGPVQKDRGGPPPIESICIALAQPLAVLPRALTATYNTQTGDFFVSNFFGNCLDFTYIRCNVVGYVAQGETSRKRGRCSFLASGAGVCKPLAVLRALFFSCATHVSQESATHVTDCIVLFCI